MAETAGKAKNFPANRHLNAVLIAMLAFKQSAVAPLRLAANDEGQLILNEGDRQWPFEPTVVSGVTVPAATAVEALGWYVNNYVEPETKLIIMIPERDVINALAAPSDIEAEGHLSVDGLNWIPNPLIDVNPDNEAGALAIAEYVLACIKPVLEGGLGISDRIIGWYLIDEPDISTRFRWALPDRLAKLRFIVRSAEQLARQTWEPGYAALSEEAQVALLRPCILTMTVPFILEDPNALPPPRRPAEYRDAEYAGSIGAADIFGFDWYPVMRTNNDIATDFSGVCLTGGPPRITALSFTTVDLVRSLRALRQLRTELNGTLLPGDVGYVPIFHWQQTDGFPFHPEQTAAEASPNKSPAFLDPPDSDSCPFEPSGRRLKLYPTLRLMQFYNWGGLRELSEGTCGFNQFLSPDIRLKDDFARVSAETEFFAAARYSSRDRLSEIVTQSLTFGPINGDTRDFMPTVVQYFDYEAAPSTPITGPHKKWLIVINRDFRQLTAQFTFVENGQRFRFQRVDFLVPTGPLSQPIIPGSRTTERFTVPAHNVLILRRINIP